ncbi:MAG: alpha/beta hydrolase-fold protein, partial [Bacteroidota bacterium]
MKLVISILCLLFIIPATGRFKLHDEPVLKYEIRQAQIKSAKPPLLILLHGLGSNEQDLFTLSRQLPGQFMVVAARAPITLSEGSYAWFRVNYSLGKRSIPDPAEIENSRRLIIQFIEQLKGKYLFDESRVYLCGFSQGGIMSYAVALTRPDVIKGIAVMSGRLLPDVKQQAASKEKLAMLKVFISHGTEDEVIPVIHAREALAYIKKLKLTHQYKEYKAGHTI